MSASKPEGVRPTHEWELLLSLFEWPEQERYEQIRPLVHFDASVAERAREWNLEEHALPQARSLRGGRDGVPLRRSGG